MRRLEKSPAGRRRYQNLRSSVSDLSGIPPIGIDGGNKSQFFYALAGAVWASL
jgi:hypothetical protein